MIDLGLDALEPHVLSVALVSARLVPVAFLCPLFGGQLSATSTKLGLVLSLALFVHFSGGVGAPPTPSAWALVGLALEEFVVGTTLGLVAALPFDAARIGGRFIDLFRGSSAEAALPIAGSKEAASGDALYQSLLAVAASSVAMPLVLAGLSRSYRLAPLGAFVHSEPVALEVVRLMGTAFATGLALGAPLVGVSLLTDALMGLASRASPNMNLQEVGAPLRILGGGAVLWLTVGVLIDRLLALVVATPETTQALLEFAR